MPQAAAKSSGVVVPENARWHQRLAAFLIHLFLSGIAATLRMRRIDRSGLNENKLSGPSIYCIWHNRLALSMEAYHGYIRHHSRGIGLAAMASASKDGAMMSAVLEFSGVQPVRGSTSRRGAQALREMTTWARRKYDLAIIPEGPRGPRYQVQMGVIAMAQLTGFPIVPVTFNVGWKMSLKSWDRFQVPLPFSTCEMIFEKPVIVPREISEEGREALRLQLEQTLNAITKD